MNDGSYAVADSGERNTSPADRSPDPGVPEPGTVPSVGLTPDASASARLKAARMELGLTTVEVARRTRITLRHIEALEAGDYGALPGRPYAIGFARAYARAVGLDDGRIADAVRTELQGSVPRSEPRVLNQFEVGDPAKTPSRLVSWLALLLAGAILAMGGIFWRSYYAPAVSLPSLVQASEEHAAATAPPKAAAAPIPASSQASTNGPVVFTALEKGIWVKFYDGQGKQLLQKQLAKGESYTVPGDVAGPRLWTGRPDALSITIAGQPVPRLAESERVMKDVPIDAASLRARPPVQGQAPAPGATSAIR